MLRHLRGTRSGLASGTPWLIPSPRSSTAVIQASLLATLWHIPALADPHLALAALALCILLAGLMQILFGMAGIARIVKFTPHPVLAGFLNGVALLLCLPQLERYVTLGPSGPGIVHPFMLAFMLALAGATIYGRRFALRVPGALFGLTTGIVTFYAVKAIVPELDLGPTMGSPGFGRTFLPALPFLGVNLADVSGKIVPLLPDLVLTALSLAIVATFDTLLTLRVAQKQAGRPLHPSRDLVANGIGNCVAALTGALAMQLSPNVVSNALKSGGRTSLTPIVGGALLLAIVLTLSPAIGAIPIVVLSSTVLANGISSFDRWSLRLLLDTLLNRGRVARRHAWHNVLVVLVVMSITASGAIVAGVLAGAALACIIFIANMSRPILRRMARGNEIVSKRVRPADAQTALLATGRRRAVLELQGVLFFGNADDLADRIVTLLDEADMVTLDMHGITDIDISGAQVLHEIVANARRRQKWLIFCNVPPDLTRTTGELARGDGRFGARIMQDLDSAVEWMEEEALRRHSGNLPLIDELALDELDFTQGLDADELALLRSRLVSRAFRPGETICVEGDAADRLWLLTKGSVSVRMALPGGERGPRREPRHGDGGRRDGAPRHRTPLGLGRGRRRRAVLGARGKGVPRAPRRASADREQGACQHRARNGAARAPHLGISAPRTRLGRHAHAVHPAFPPCARDAGRNRGAIDRDRHRHRAGGSRCLDVSRDRRGLSAGGGLHRPDREGKLGRDARPVSRQQPGPGGAGRIVVGIFQRGGAGAANRHRARIRARRRSTARSSCARTYPANSRRRAT